MLPQAAAVYWRRLQCVQCIAQGSAYFALVDLRFIRSSSSWSAEGASLVVLSTALVFSLLKLYTPAQVDM